MRALLESIRSLAGLFSVGQGSAGRVRTPDDLGESPFYARLKDTPQRDKKLATDLMKIDEDIWRSKGWDDASGPWGNWDDYKENVEVAVRRIGIRPGTLSERVWEILENENYHSINGALDDLAMYKVKHYTDAQIKKLFRSKSQ
jgi:hypothetical protein